MALIPAGPRRARWIDRVLARTKGVPVDHCLNPEVSAPRHPRRSQDRQASSCARLPRAGRRAKGHRRVADERGRHQRRPSCRPEQTWSSCRDRDVRLPHRGRTQDRGEQPRFWSSAGTPPLDTARLRLRPPPAVPARHKVGKPTLRNRQRWTGGLVRDRHCPGPRAVTPVTPAALACILRDRRPTQPATPRPRNSSRSPRPEARPNHSPSLDCWPQPAAAAFSDPGLARSGHFLTPPMRSWRHAGSFT